METGSRNLSAQPKFTVLVLGDLGFQHWSALLQNSASWGAVSGSFSLCFTLDSYLCMCLGAQSRNITGFSNFSLCVSIWLAVLNPRQHPDSFSLCHNGTQRQSRL